MPILKALIRPAYVWTRVQPLVSRQAGLPVVFYFDKDSFPAALVNQKDCMLRAIAWMSSGQGYGKQDGGGWASWMQRLANKGGEEC